MTHLIDRSWPRLVCRFALAAAVPVVVLTQSAPARPASHVVIPFLANATNPSALEFEGADCDVDASGSRMTCAFQQVFLTTSGVAPDTCLVTTNRYERVFARQPDQRWVSREEHGDPCGTVDVATLQDGGGVRWTMELRTLVTDRSRPACREASEERQSLGWQNLRRPLPCKFVQPGGLSR
jgi:hypothetical protein